MQRMKTTQDLRDALNGCKGGGRWALIAAHAGCDYNYLTRIARGKSVPSLDIAVRLFAAIEAQASAVETAKAA